MNDYILDDLREAAHELKRIEKTIRELIGIARNKGQSWERIAQTLGVTRQAAFQRYGKLDAHPDPTTEESR